MIEEANPLTTEEAHELYLKLWEKEQSYIQIRWTVVTFFIGISFGILGFSFNFDTTNTPFIIPQLIGCAIYWFAFLVHLVLYDLTEYYRGYLLEMEQKNLVKYDIRKKADIFFSEKRRKITRTHPTRLLAYFGIGYVVVIVLSAIDLYLL